MKEIRWSYDPKWSLSDEDEIWDSDGLSAKAKGIFAHMAQKPPRWDFSAERISRAMKDGLGAIKAGLRELEERGYLKRTKLGNGRVVHQITANSGVGIEPIISKSYLEDAEVEFEFDAERCPKVNIVDHLMTAYSAYGMSRKEATDIVYRYELKNVEHADYWMSRNSPSCVPVVHVDF
jgi:hypothetical protein